MSILPEKSTKIGTAVTLFAGTLVLLLGGSQLFILPKLTQVSMADHTYDAVSIQSYTAALQTEVQALQADQLLRMRPIASKAYNAAITAKYTQPIMSEWLQTMTAVFADFTANNQPMFTISSIQTKQVTGAVEVTVQGVLQQAGFQTQTVLAQSVEKLQNLPGTASVQPSRFVRITQADGTYSSPFTLTITLQI